MATPGGQIQYVHCVAHFRFTEVPAACQACWRRACGRKLPNRLSRPSGAAATAPTTSHGGKRNLLGYWPLAFYEVLARSLQPLTGTTCRNHLPEPLAGTTHRNHLRKPLAGTTCKNHLQVPLAGTTCRNITGTTCRNRRNDALASGSPSAVPSMASARCRTKGLSPMATASQIAVVSLTPDLAGLKLQSHDFCPTS